MCKKTLLIIITSIFFFSLYLPAFADSVAELDIDEVTAIAWTYMEVNSGLTAEEMTDFHCQLQELGDLWEGTRYWTIVFESDITGSEFWVQVDYMTGHVYDVDRSGYAEEYRRFREMAKLQAVAAEARAVWERERGPYVFWDYEDKATFYMEYPGADPCYLPSAEDISEAEAVQITNEEIRKVLLADETYLDSYRLDTCFRKEFFVGDMSAPTWLITYRISEPTADGVYPIRHMAIVNAVSGETTLFVHHCDSYALISADMYLDVMYYNPDGGIYFHHDADCGTVHERYKPLRAYSRSDIIYDDALLSLIPCERCAYHHEGDWGSDWTRG